MAIRERLVYAIDVVTDGANKGLANFRTAVSQAETTTGKFKAGAASAFESVKANAANLALAGGAALVAFGAKAVAAFQETALEAGKFSDATGLAVEDASRWIEVAGDVGVSADTIQGAFVRMNKAIGDGGPVVEKYGLHLITTADGAADVNQTMLTTIRRIGAIKDPTERAAAAQQVFGRSYAEAAEIIFDSADNVKRKLGEVSDAKVISEDELAKARRFRESMDNLHDSLEDISLVVGEELVPALADVADLAVQIKDGFNSIPKAPWIVQKWWDLASPVAWQRHLVNGYEKVGNAAVDAGKTIGGWFGIGGGGSGKVAEGVKATTTASDQYVESLEHMHQAAIATAAEHEKLTDSIAKNKEQEESYIDLLAGRAVRAYYDVQRAVDRARRAHLLEAKAIADAQDAALSGLDTMFDYEKATLATADAVTALADAQGNDLRPAQIDAAEAALQQAQAFASSKGAIDGSTLSAQLQLVELQRLAAQFPELSSLIQGYIDKLNGIPAVKSTQLVVTSSGAVTTKQTQNQFGRLIAGAEGAIVSRPTLALIGEAGPEAVVPLSQSPGNSPLPAGIGAAAATVSIGPVYITANDTESVYDKLAREARMKGPGPILRALGIE